MNLSKKSGGWGALGRVVGLSLAVPFLTVPALAAGNAAPTSLAASCSSFQVDSCRQCVMGGGGSGEIPTPLGLVNQTVELAAGEVYALEGRVVFTGGYPFLEIDLQKHPWLANSMRVSFPYYPLDGGVGFWRPFIGMRVKVMGKAQWMLVEMDDAVYSLGLYPLLQPLPLPGTQPHPTTK